MEPQRDEDVDICFPESINTALNISLIIDKICSFASPADLLAFRLVNHVFHNHATSRLRVVGHNPVDLRKEGSVDKFLTFLKTRVDPEDSNTYPFTSFELNLHHSTEIIERFLADTGRHVQRFKFHEMPLNNHKLPGDMSMRQAEQNLIVLLNLAPNIDVIDIHTKFQWHLFNSDLTAFPKSFPRLKVIKVDYEHLDREEHSGPPDSTPLLNLLITRALRLKSVETVHVEKSPDEFLGLSALQALSQYHSLRAPLLGITLACLEPQTLHVLQELKNLNLRLEKLELDVTVGDVQPQAVLTPNFILYQLSSWLNIQSATLRCLFLTLFITETHESVTFTIPSLPAMTEFKFTLDLRFRIRTRFYVILTPNNFSALRKLDINLKGWPEEQSSTTFHWYPLPSVQNFTIRSWSFLMESFSWHRILPNLNFLTFLGSVNFDGIEKQNLSYILRHFPRITGLCMTLWFHLSDYWDVLTGGAIRPASTEALLHGDLDQNEMEPEEPVEGVYQIPSLGNLRALTTLTCYPDKRSNLDAIVYMTRVGCLRPLDRLIVLSRYMDMMDEEKMAYRDVLSQVHSEVHFEDKCDWKF